MKRYRFTAGSLLILTGIIHIAVSFFYGLPAMTGYLVFGFIYLLPGVLLLILANRWIVVSAIALPAIGLIASLSLVIKTGHMISVYPLLVLIDIAVIVISIKAFIIKPGEP